MNFDLLAMQVNHFPGTSCIVSKPILASHGFPFTPKAFKIPDEADRFKEEVCLLHVCVCHIVCKG